MGRLQAVRSLRVLPDVYNTSYALTLKAYNFMLSLFVSPCDITIHNTLVTDLYPCIVRFLTTFLHSPQGDLPVFQKRGNRVSGLWSLYLLKQTMSSSPKSAWQLVHNLVSNLLNAHIHLPDLTIIIGNDFISPRTYRHPKKRGNMVSGIEK
jgi:hypothetical protein